MYRARVYRYGRQHYLQSIHSHVGRTLASELEKNAAYEFRSRDLRIMRPTRYQLRQSSLISFAADSRVLAHAFLVTNATVDPHILNYILVHLACIQTLFISTDVFRFTNFLVWTTISSVLNLSFFSQILLSSSSVKNFARVPSPRT